MNPDPSLRDEQLENEIRLVGDLVLAASRQEGPLSEDEIDAVLGLDPAEDSEPSVPSDDEEKATDRSEHDGTPGEAAAD